MTAQINDYFFDWLTDWLDVDDGLTNWLSDWLPDLLIFCSWSEIAEEMFAFEYREIRMAVEIPSQSWDHLFQGQNQQV